MANSSNDRFLQADLTRGSLLNELQIIWDELGESNAEKDKMLLELEQECLNVYRRKVDQANQYRAQLRQAMANAEAEIAVICSELGERPLHISQSSKTVGSLKEQLKAISLKLEEMQIERSNRLNQCLEVVGQIQKISTELYSTDCNPFKLDIDESDLSIMALEDLQRQLQTLQKEKSDRLRQVMDHLNTLSRTCEVLGVNFKETIRQIHPSLGQPEESINLSDDTIKSLVSAIENLQKIKLERMQKLQDLASSLLEMWHLMDTPNEEQQQFQNVTCNIAASEQEITDPDALSLDTINIVEAEVSRLEQQKASKMIELIERKKTELEEIRQRTHLVAEAEEPEFPLDAVQAGAIDASLVLEQLEAQISAAKEEAFSRKDILERVEKWLSACEEETWLEEYNRDENRYNAGRGIHLTLKRAEKARALVSKIPAMVETLVNKVTVWEKERDTEFIYDGDSLLPMLENYTMVSQEKEQERKKQRDQKRLQGQLTAEQDVLGGSKTKPQVTKKTQRTLSQKMSIGSKADLFSQKCTNTPKKVDELGSAVSSEASDPPDKKSSSLPHGSFELSTPHKAYKSVDGAREDVNKTLKIIASFDSQKFL